MDERRQTQEEFEREYEAATERARVADREEPRAERVYFDPESGRIMVELRNGCLFAFPPELGEGLAGGTPEQWAEVEVTPSGSGLHWKSLDADLSIPRLLAGVFGSARWMSELGRQGGRITSEAKARAARDNGRKGGRPRKRDKESRETREPSANMAEDPRKTE